MRRSTLTGLLTTASSLLLARAAPAAYVGLSAEIVNSLKIDGESWDVARVYANVDNPEDRIEAISGNSANPIMIQSLDGAFYQNKQFGMNNTEPSPVQIAVDPSLEWDTFVTIGNAILDPIDGPTMVQGLFPPDGPGFMGDSLVTVGFWLKLPGNAATVAGDDLRVLIGQFTIPSGGGLEGTVRVAGNFDGTPTQFIGETFVLVRCLGDTNGDKTVDVDDLVNVILDWSTDGSVHGGDVDGSGVVDVDDLTTIIQGWGACA